VWMKDHANQLRALEAKGETWDAAWDGSTPPSDAFTHGNAARELLPHLDVVYRLLCMSQDGLREKLADEKYQHFVEQKAKTAIDKATAEAAKPASTKRKNVVIPLLANTVAKMITEVVESLAKAQDSFKTEYVPFILAASSRAQELVEDVAGSTEEEEAPDEEAEEKASDEKEDEQAAPHASENFDSLTDLFVLLEASHQVLDMPFEGEEMEKLIPPVTSSTDALTRSVIDCVQAIIAHARRSEKPDTRASAHAARHVRQVAGTVDDSVISRVLIMWAATMEGGAST
jgi:hypothetical protein